MTFFRSLQERSQQTMVGIKHHCREEIDCPTRALIDFQQSIGGAGANLAGHDLVHATKLEGARSGHSPNHDVSFGHHADDSSFSLAHGQKAKPFVPHASGRILDRLTAHEVLSRLAHDLGSKESHRLEPES